MRQWGHFFISLHTTGLLSDTSGVTQSIARGTTLCRKEALNINFIELFYIMGNHSNTSLFNMNLSVA